MKTKISKEQKHLYIAGICILLIGLACSGAAYILADKDTTAGDTIGYEDINGTIYPESAENSKAYMRNLEVLNGKAGVFAVEFNQWFISLWEGESLAVTLASISIAISCAFCFVAYRS
jgi:hypothetical protein